MAAPAPVRITPAPAVPAGAFEPKTTGWEYVPQVIEAALKGKMAGEEMGRARKEQDLRTKLLEVQIANARSDQDIQEIQAAHQRMDVLRQQFGDPEALRMIIGNPEMTKQYERAYGLSPTMEVTRTKKIAREQEAGGALIPGKKPKFETVEEEVPVKERVPRPFAPRVSPDALRTQGALVQQAASSFQTVASNPRATTQQIWTSAKNLNSAVQRARESYVRAGLGTVEDATALFPSMSQEEIEAIIVERKTGGTLTPQQQLDMMKVEAFKRIQAGTATNADYLVALGKPIEEVGGVRYFEWKGQRYPINQTYQRFLFWADKDYRDYILSLPAGAAEAALGFDPSKTTPDDQYKYTQKTIFDIRVDIQKAYGEVQALQKTADSLPKSPIPPPGLNRQQRREWIEKYIGDKGKAEASLRQAQAKMYGLQSAFGDLVLNHSRSVLDGRPLNLMQVLEDFSGRPIDPRLWAHYDDNVKWYLVMNGVKPPAGIKYTTPSVPAPATPTP